MTQNEKELLLKDLCTRLPYNVFVNINGIECVLQPHDISDLTKCDKDIKPYLFPLSNMTEEQKQEYQYITERWMYDSSYSISDSIDWLNKNHFDYRGLIPKGLAIDASKLNIY